MSEIAIPPDDAFNKVREEIRAALRDRARFEPEWHSNLAFAAGKFRHVWNRTTRRLEEPPDDVGRENYSVDVITEYRTTALGEMGSDDDRPQLLIRREDGIAEDYQQALNEAVGWGWDNEWQGDDILRDVDRLVVDLGTAAVRCRWDGSVGPVMQDVPFYQGQPVLDPARQSELFANGPNADVQMNSVREGRIVWEALSAFNLIVPPGIPNERDFPWECVVRPTPLADVKALYGRPAASLSADSDIGSILGFQSGSAHSDGERGAPGKLRDHVWLYTFYRRPSPQYPDGQKVTFAGKQMVALENVASLPYQDSNGQPCSGISYFHWWRVTGRFWSRSLTANTKDIQRNVDKRRRQINDIIDRGLPAVFVDKNSPAKERRGLALELIELRPNERQPFVTPSVNPGQWMYQDVEAAREDLEHATGIRAARLGENPVNVTTYAQLAQLNENDSTKREAIYTERRGAIGSLVEFSVYDIRRYWGREKKLAIVGEDEVVSEKVFDATKIPSSFIVKAAKGPAKPRSQAAELKKIEELWSAVVATQTFIAKPFDWVKWLADSLDAGQVLDTPASATDMHADKATPENPMMISGETPAVQYYDVASIHIPIHRMIQIQAEQTGNLALWRAIEQHVQAHVLIAQNTAGLMTQMQPQLASPGAPTPQQPAPLAAGAA